MLQDGDTPDMISKCLNCVRSECTNCLDFAPRFQKAQGKGIELDYGKVERLYMHGLTDLEIAHHLQCHRHTVYRWRTRNDFFANVKPRSH